MSNSRRYVCSRPGCPNVVTGKQAECPSCKAQRAAERPGRQERGYDASHDAERLRWAPVVARGEVDCARCGKRIGRGEPWALDHRDDRAGYLGPSHRSCNDAAGARKGNAQRKGHRP